MPDKGNIRVGTGLTIAGNGEVLGNGLRLNLDLANIDHGSLGGLSDADHSAYSLTSHTHTGATSETLFSQTATVTIANTTTETTLVGSGAGSATLAANYLAVGKTIRVSAMGYYSTKSSVPGQLRIKIKFGSTVLVTYLTTVTILQSNQLWTVESLITCRTTGGSGTVMPQGLFTLFVSSAITASPLTTTAAVAVDTTSTQAVSITAEWTVADASNTISCSNFVIEGLL